MQDISGLSKVSIIYCVLCVHACVRVCVFVRACACVCVCVCVCAIDITVLVHIVNSCQEGMDTYMLYRLFAIAIT